MFKFVKLCNADKNGKPVHVNAANILWFEQVAPQQTVLTFVSDRKLVVLGCYDEVTKALDRRDDT